MRPTTVRQCAVLAGGMGTRFGVLTERTPRPFLAGGDRPFLAWLLREFVRFGVAEFVLLAGHHAEEIEARVQELVGASAPQGADCRVARAGAGRHRGGVVSRPRSPG